MTNAFNLSQLANNTNSSGQVTLTTGVAGTLPVANGGTGAATLTTGNLLVGAGTSAVTGIAAGTSGNVLTSNGTTWASALPASSVLQVGVTTFDGYVAASAAAGGPTSISAGYGLFSLSFTPVSATSKILVQTSTISVYEPTNVGNYFWVALWDGSTFIAANSGTVGFQVFANALNAGYYTLNNSYTSGSTSTRTISVRVGGALAQTLQINGNANGALTGSSARIQMTVWEIAA